MHAPSYTRLWRACEDGKSASVPSAAVHALLSRLEDANPAEYFSPSQQAANVRREVASARVYERRQQVKEEGEERRYGAEQAHQREREATRRKFETVRAAHAKKRSADVQRMWQAKEKEDKRNQQTQSRAEKDREKEVLGRFVATRMTAQEYISQMLERERQQRQVLVGA
jgi:hypothetical protein